jgi:hypothetical protein
MMTGDSPATRILRFVLALALLGSLAWAGARIYRRLPDTDAGAMAPSGAQQDVTIVLRVSGSSETRIKLYPIDVARVERDYARGTTKPRKSFDDFLAQRLKDLTPVTASADASGRAVARITEGQWWMHAVTAFPEGEWLEWRQQLNISQKPQTIELSSANAYERSKKF